MGLTDDELGGDDEDGDDDDGKGMIGESAPIDGMVILFELSGTDPLNVKCQARRRNARTKRRRRRLRRRSKLARHELS
jgi:hypothetical protein